MFPCLATFDIADGGFIDAKSVRYLSLRHFGRNQFSYSDDVCLDEFGSSVSHTFCPRTVLIHIVVIFLWSAPSKIGELVVGRVSVQMTAPVSRWARPNKRVKYKLVDGQVRHQVVSAEVDVTMSFAVRNRPQNFPYMCASPGTLSTNLPLVRDSIPVFEANNGKPSFMSHERFVHDSYGFGKKNTWFRNRKFY